MSNLNDATMGLDLLDAKLDDLADLPEWRVFPDGVYKVKPTVKIEKKPSKADPKVKETIITVGAKLLEIKEVDEKAERLEIGSETSCRYTWENEFGQGGLKALLKPISAVTGIGGVSQLLEILGSADDVILVMGHRDSTNAQSGKTTTYQTFTDLIVS